MSHEMYDFLPVAMFPFGQRSHASSEIFQERTISMLRLDKNHHVEPAVVQLSNSERLSEFAKQHHQDNSVSAQSRQGDCPTSSGLQIKSAAVAPGCNSCKVGDEENCSSIHEAERQATEMLLRAPVARSI